MEMNKECKAPKTMEECFEVTKNLWSWAENLEKYGRILLGVITVIGLAAAIYAGIEADEIHESVWGAVLSAAFTWILYAIIEYCTFNALSLLMSALATIVQNTTISANIAAHKGETDLTVANNQIAANQKNLFCPQCFSPVKYGDSKCPKCGQAFDWSKMQS